MSLKLTNKLTDKQRRILNDLQYIGTWDLTVEQASKLIDELIEEKRLSYGEIQGIAGDYYDFPEDYSEAQYRFENDNNGWRI